MYAYMYVYLVSFKACFYVIYSGFSAYLVNSCISHVYAIMYILEAVLEYYRTWKLNQYHMRSWKTKEAFGAT